MQFTINSKTLLSAIAAVGKVVPAKAVIQILTNFLVEVKDGEVAITASDTENRASVTIQAQTGGEGKFCIEARFLINIIRSLPECPVTISVNDKGDVAITTEKNTFNAVAVGADDYPLPEQSSCAVAEFQLPTESMLMGFAETSFAVGADDFHPQMMGVCLDVKSDRVVFVATDTRQLVKSVHQAQTDADFRCIVPIKAMGAVTALAAKSPSVTVTAYPSSIKFAGDGFCLSCQLIKGNYPDYNRVIPQDNGVIATFSRTGLLGAVRRVASCADSAYGRLRFDFNDDRVTISSSDTAFSRSATETVECDSNGARLSIGLAAGLLAGLLSSLPTETIKFAMKDSGRPVVLSAVGDDQHLTMLLMPMHID